MVKRTRPDPNADLYSLHVTFGELKSYCESVVDMFQTEAGVSIDYEIVGDMPLSIGKTTMRKDGDSSVQLGMNGITVVDPDDEKVYAEETDDSALVPDRNVAGCLMTLEHELQHARQNYMEWTRNSDERAPEYILLSHLAFSCNFELYLQSHVWNIRETDADSVGFIEGLKDLAEFCPGFDTDAVMLEYINSRWDDGRVYRIGSRGMEFESVDEVKNAFKDAIEEFKHEEPQEFPYKFPDAVAAWTDQTSHLAMTVRSLTNPKSKERWHGIFQSIQNSKTRAEFDRKAASVMLYVHPEYKDEFNLDGIDLSPQTVFGISEFPETARFVQGRLGLKMKLPWITRTQMFREGIPEPERDASGSLPEGVCLAAGEAVKPATQSLSREELQSLLAAKAREDDRKKAAKLADLEYQGGSELKEALAKPGLPDFNEKHPDVAKDGVER